MVEEYKKYPVLTSAFEKTKEYVPWDMLSPHENRAYRNHGQSLEELARRGGLGWGEILAILEDRPWSSISRDEAKNREAVLHYVSEYSATSKEDGGNGNG